jgi:hypothetical protein
MEEKMSLAYSKLDELLEVHKDYPMTTNSQFINNSRRPRQDASKLDLDMDMVAAGEAFDNMNAYYEVCKTLFHYISDRNQTDNIQVALNLFTDNVPTLAVQAPLIREVPKIFCPTAVFSMDTGVINRIAGETEEKIMERDSILHRLATLEKGALICRRYAKRPQQGKYSRIPSMNQPDQSSSSPFIR